MKFDRSLFFQVVEDLLTKEELEIYQGNTMRITNL